jgi:hypothetical protein
LRGIDDSASLLGVTFLDSTAVKAFGDDNIATEIARELEVCAKVNALRKVLERAMTQLRLAAPNIDISVMSRVN